MAGDFQGERYRMRRNRTYAVKFVLTVQYLT